MKTRIIIAALAASYTLTMLPEADMQTTSSAVQSNTKTKTKAAKQARLSKRQQREARAQEKKQGTVPGQNVVRSAGNVVEDAGGYTKDVVTSPQNVVQDTGTLTKNVLDDATSWLPWRNKSK